MMVEERKWRRRLARKNYGVEEELKTLKDIFEDGTCPDCSKKIDKCKCDYKELFITIKRDVLKQEAIKHLKGEKGDKQIFTRKEWMDFFAISEEDLA